MIEMENELARFVLQNDARKRSPYERVNLAIQVFRGTMKDIVKFAADEILFDDADAAEVFNPVEVSIERLESISLKKGMSKKTINKVMESLLGPSVALLDAFKENGGAMDSERIELVVWMADCAFSLRRVVELFLPEMGTPEENDRFLISRANEVIGKCHEAIRHIDVDHLYDDGLRDALEL